MITVNELFSGIGAQVAALKRIGLPYKVVGISEIDKFAIKSYEAMNGATRNYGDISKIERLDYADLWTYSFCCQDLSIAGKMKGFKDENGNKTRSGLLLEVERLLEIAVKEKSAPKYLLLENVKNLVGKRFKADFDRWLSKLSELGYNNYWKVLNAKDYGVPQNRERVFVVSIRKDVDLFGYTFPQKIELTKKLKDLLEQEVDEKFYLSEDFLNYMKRKEDKNYNFRVEVSDENSIRKTPIRAQGDRAVIGINTCADGTCQALTAHLHKETVNDCIKFERHSPATGVLEIGVGHNPISKKFEFDGFHDQPAPTLLATDYKAPKCYSDGIRIRKLTPRECWRLMGFTDEEFTAAQTAGVSNTQLYKQAGNSIVVDVLAAIFKNLFENRFCDGCQLIGGI